MKLSEINAQLVKQYARIDGAEDDALIEEVILPSARGYVLSYTGLDSFDADSYPDLALAGLALACHLYDHRDAVGDKGQINQVLDSILGLHVRHLLA